ncbi:MAG: hypothetical protein J5685_12880 [Clostridiales bacterium]|nr:hypothetical protein [Clostridiales bacterium]
METRDNVITKIISILASAWILLITASNGMPFMYGIKEALLVIFFDKNILEPKIKAIVPILICACALTIVSLIISLLFFYKGSKILPSLFTEVIACLIFVTGSALFFILFFNAGATISDRTGAAVLLLIDLWFLIVLIFKAVRFFNADKKMCTCRKNAIFSAVPVILVFIIVSVCSVVKYSVKAGYENYLHDLRSIDVPFDSNGYNSLSSSVTINDTVYGVVFLPEQEHHEYVLAKIGKDGETEVIDNGVIEENHLISILRQNVAAYNETVFYAKSEWFGFSEEPTTVIACYDTRNGQRFEISAGDVPREQSHVFGNYTHILGIWDGYLYLDESSSHEIWRVRIGDGLIEKDTLQKYLWGYSRNPLAVCYKGLLYCDNTLGGWPGTVGLESGDSTVHTYYETSSEDLSYSGVSLRDVRRYSVHVKLPENADATIHDIIALNIYNGELYYATIDGDVISIMRSDLSLSSPELIDSYEVNGGEVNYYFSTNRLMVSDTYLVFASHEGPIVNVMS